MCISISLLMMSWAYQIEYSSADSIHSLIHLFSRWYSFRHSSLQPMVFMTSFISFSNLPMKLNLINIVMKFKSSMTYVLFDNSKHVVTQWQKRTVEFVSRKIKKFTLLESLIATINIFHDKGKENS